MKPILIWPTLQRILGRDRKMDYELNIELGFLALSGLLSSFSGKPWIKGPLFIFYLQLFYIDIVKPRKNPIFSEKGQNGNFDQNPNFF